MDLTLPLDHAAIERILLHRYPFLLVDRVTELEIDKRIVGIKNVSRNDHYLSIEASGASVFPPTLLTEAIAQVGAILILAKPENRQRLPLLAGIKRFRFRQPDGTDFRLREYGARDVGVINPDLTLAEHRVGKGVALADRNRGQIEAMGDVADRIDAVHRAS